MTSEQSFLTFEVGNRWYAVDVQSVFEVYLMMTIAAVPDMPPAILGIVNLRGRIVPIVDLRIRFHTADDATDLTTPIIFVRYDDDHIYGMVVDDVDDVINLDATTINSTQLNQRARHIQGLTDHRGRLIMILDPVRLMTSTLDEETLEELSHHIQQHTDRD